MKNLYRYFTAKTVLNWPVFVMATAWALLANLTDAGANGDGHYPLRTVLVTALHTGVFGFIWLINKTVITRSDKTLRPFLLVAAIMTAMVGRAVALGYLSYALGITEIVVLRPRIITAFTAQSVAVFLLAWGYGQIAENEKKRRELVQAREQLLALGEEANVERAERNKNFVLQIRRELTKELKVDGKATPEETLEVLHSSIHNVVRPLSRLLDNRSSHIPLMFETQRTHIYWPRVFVEMLYVRNIRTIPAVFFFVSAIIAPAIHLLGPKTGASLVIILAIINTVSSIILHKYFYQSSRFIRVLLILGVVVAGGVPAPLLIHPFVPADFFVPVTLGYYGTAIGSFLVTALVISAASQSRELALSIQNDNADLAWALARENASSKLQHQFIAQALHGRTQASLAAAAFRLQRAIREGGDLVEATNHAREEAERVVNFDIDFGLSTQSIQIVIDEITEVWDGVSKITNTLSINDIARINSDPLCVRVMSELVIELCMNAVKHGKADVIVISCTWPDHRTLRLQIDDNGMNHVGQTPKGLGSKLLNEMTVNWHRVRTSHGTQVVCLIPWQANE